MFNKKIERGDKRREDAVEYKKDIAITRKFHSAEEYVKQLRDKGYEVSDHVLSALEEMNTEEGGDNVTIARFTLEDIGLPRDGDDRITTGEVFDTAGKEEKLSPCPAWAALQYCLESLEHYTDEKDVHKYSAIFGIKLPEKILEGIREDLAMETAKEDIKMKVKKGEIEKPGEEEMERILNEQAKKRLDNDPAPLEVLEVSAFSAKGKNKKALSLSSAPYGGWQHSSKVWVFAKKES